MQTSSPTLGELIDRALFEAEAPPERGLRVVLSDALTTSGTQFTLSSGSLNVSDLVEFGQELMLVTGKTEASPATYTVSRGYYSTTAAAHPASTVGVVNPQWPRRRVAEAIDRSLTRIQAMGVQLVTSARLTPVTDLKRLELPADCRRVLQVLYAEGSSGRIIELDGWEEFSTVSTETSSTGKALELPWYVLNADVLEVVYSKAMSWSTASFPDESATVELPASAEDLPSSYAAAWLVEGREVSRAELDRSPEWSAVEPSRTQSGVGLVRLKWQNFYRALDEAMRLTAYEMPKPRPRKTLSRVGRYLN